VNGHLRVYHPDELGRDGYPREWHTIDGGPGIKHLVRAEAGERCVRCGHPYRKGAGEWSACDEQCRHGSANVVASKARWRILTVHHLNGDKADCRWWNLAALCQRCHLQVQGRVVMERIWPWPHTEWFKPYAAGWYAHAYLGLDLTREQTLERLDELLALELQVTP
jgi:hypothetical protein